MSVRHVTVLAFFSAGMFWSGQTSSACDKCGWLLNSGRHSQSLQEQDEFRWQGRIAPGQTLEVKGINGPVLARPASGDEAVVMARKSARHSDPEEVEIEVVEHEDGVTICAVYPSTGHKENRCAPGREGRMSVHDNDVRVRFTVSVPAGVRFVGKTVNGDVEASELGGSIRAQTVNGAITISTAGAAEATTVNGSITATLGSVDWEGEVEFSTVNGSVTVYLPDDVSAEVRAETVSGHIDSDFPLTVRGRFGGRRMRGTIGDGGDGGDGGRELHLKTVNGSIRLRRAGR